MHKIFKSKIFIPSAVISLLVIPLPFSNAHGGIFSDVGGFILDYTLGAVMALMAFILNYIATVVLNLSITILNFSADLEPLFKIGVWEIVRDIGNLAIILFLGFTAIALIVNVGDGLNKKKAIVWVLGAALLINFSGLLTKSVYQVSQVATQEFKSNALKHGGTTRVLTVVGIDATRLTKEQADKLREESESPGGNKIGLLEASIYSMIEAAKKLVLAMGFLYGAAFLIGRIVGLSIIYALSPLGLVAYMLNKAGNAPSIVTRLATQWWDKLWGLSFSACVFFFGLWLAIKLGESSLDKLPPNKDSIENIALALIQFMIFYIVYVKSIEQANAMSGGVGDAFKKGRGAVKGWGKRRYDNNKEGLKRIRNTAGTAAAATISRATKGRVFSHQGVKFAKQIEEGKDYVRSGFAAKGSDKMQAFKAEENLRAQMAAGKKNLNFKGSDNKGLRDAFSNNTLHKERVKRMTKSAWGNKNNFKDFYEKQEKSAKKVSEKPKKKS